MNIVKISVIFFMTSLIVESRSWTSTHGSTINAELIDFSNRIVSLKKPSGDKISLRINKLIPSDQAFVREWDANKNKKKNVLKPKPKENTFVFTDFNNHSRVLPPKWGTSSAEDYTCVLEKVINEELSIRPYSPHRYSGIEIYRKNYDKRGIISLPEDYCSSCLPKSMLPSHEILSIEIEEYETVKNLDALLKFPKLMTVRIRDCHIEKLEPLSKLKYLVACDLVKNRIKSIDPLVNCVWLNYLNVGSNNIRYIDKSLPNFKTLSYIDLFRNPLKIDPSPLRNIKKTMHCPAGCLIDRCGNPYLPQKMNFSAIFSSISTDKEFFMEYYKLTRNPNSGIR